jgi:protein associated with RNAse G/E
MTTVTIYKPDGTIHRSFQEPATWSFDEEGVFTVVAHQYAGGPSVTIRTTLPVMIEQTP